MRQRAPEQGSAPRRSGPGQVEPMSDEYRWFAGVDWASTAHQVGVMDAKGQVAAERVFYARLRERGHSHPRACAVWPTVF
jgi:hypothetical protein